MATSRELSAIPTIAADVLGGLSQPRKSLPPKLFYDARGSALFEQICELPEYYLTRTERAILESNIDVIAAAAGNVHTVVELGAGSASKTALLLQALARRDGLVTYVPIDVSGSALRAAARQLRAQLPRLRLAPVVADYTCGVPIPPQRAQPRRVPGTPPREDTAPRLILYIGSSIGNFDPMEAAALLARVRRTMQAADRLLLGVDLAKSPQVLLPAYNDAQGVTAAFNKNILHRINRELEGDFDLDRFHHVAVWNQQESRVEMHLKSTVAQQVWLSSLPRSFCFEAGETIHTENSYKYTPAMLRWLFGAASMTSLQSWTDDRHWFELHMLAPLST
ncbi:MAG: L-histidine N(alpha)-methyltransferase [Candidatus Korobacteraceae bacterium]|jgi:dimethylhistidine N-methyltransferase